MWISGAPKEFKDDKVVISPVFRESTAKALWEFIEGSASYLFNACTVPLMQLLLLSLRI
jgi:hypothetical protein